MLGEIKGYAFLISADDVFIGYNGQIDPKGYEEIKNDIYGPKPIIDFAVDGNGLLCLDHKGRCILQVNDMKAVKWWFKCDTMCGVLLPPCDNFYKRMYEYGIRMQKLNGNYDKWTRAAVITNSFLKGHFDDSFLFKE